MKDEKRKRIENLNPYQVGHRLLCINHALFRAKERYNIKLKVEDLHNIINLILNQNAGFVKRLSTFRTIWDVGYKKILFRVIYNKKLGMIQTFLYKDMEIEYQNEYIEMEEGLNKLKSCFPIQKNKERGTQTSCNTISEEKDQ